MVAFVAAFPDAVIGDAIGPSDVINEVLDEVRLVATAHHREATPSELRQLEKKERGDAALLELDRVAKALERIGLLERVVADRSRWQQLEGVVAIPWQAVAAAADGQEVQP